MLWKNTGITALRLFFPNVCLHCYKQLSITQNYLCEACEENLTELYENTCKICGKLIYKSECEDCWENDFRFKKAKSIFVYEGAVKSLIHEMKYNHFYNVSTFLAQKASQYLQKHKLFKKIDLITAVPLHTVRKRERGFNQSELIARKLGLKLNIPYIETVNRRYYTESQTNLTHVERMKNLSGAFKLRKVDLFEKNILLIDDVFTTGSTVNEVSRVLETGKPKNIYVLTMARA